MLPTPDVGNIDYENVYEPAEDSFLLLDALEEQRAFLEHRFKEGIPFGVEIGTGTGIVATFISRHILKLSLMLATDVNPHACEAALKTFRKNLVSPAGHEDGTKVTDCCRMSLATAVRAKTVDLLVFNPPYVPSEETPDFSVSSKNGEWLDYALLGGAEGMEITKVVLDALHLILRPKVGVAYILFCARNKPSKVAEYMRKRGWTVDLVCTRKAGWEVLTVLRFMNSTLE